MRKEYNDRWNAPLVHGPVNLLGEPIVVNDAFEQLELDFETTSDEDLLAQLFGDDS
jgi:hypothetical protein